MDALKLIITILQLLCGIAIILAVLIQSGKSAGLSGAIGGVADSFLSKNKAKTMDAKLARATKWIGAVFLILTLVLHVFGNTILLLLRQRTLLHLWTDLAGLRFSLLVLVQTLLFCAIFTFLPAEQPPFRRNLPGALFASFGWMTASAFFSMYVDYFPRYANIFGSVYAVALTGFWLYICVSILFYGAVLNRILMETD